MVPEVISSSPPVRITATPSNASSTPGTPSKFLHSHPTEANGVNNEPNLRKSYDLKALNRLCFLASSSRHVSSEYTNAKASLESALDMTKYLRQRRNQLLEATIRVSHIQRKLDQERSKLEKKQKQMEENESLINHRRQEISNREQDFIDLTNRLEQEKVTIKDIEVKLQENNKSIEKHRSALVRELVACSFAICLDGQTCPTINGFRLPDSRQNVVQSSSSWSWFPSRRCEVNDVEMSIAVGHVVHLLLLLSRILDIPLKYHLIFCGSQSIIVDHLNIGTWRHVLGTLPNGPANEIRVALYVTNRGSKDSRLYFEYGMYLLNQSIGQLKFTSGTILNKHSEVKKIDLAPTLSNLRDILSLYSIISDGDSICECECNLSGLKSELDSLMSANDTGLLIKSNGGERGESR